MEFGQESWPHEITAVAAGIGLWSDSKLLAGRREATLRRL